MTLKPWDAYWLVWTGVLFLVPELLAAFHLIPLDTFSGTTQISERLHPWLTPIVFGFGVGLVIHLVYDVNFFRALTGGAVAAAAAAIFGGLPL